MMSERIIELADRAVEDISTGPWNISDEFCIKFAELIVRECAKVGERYADGNYEVYNQIMAHFGVEEE